MSKAPDKGSFPLDHFHECDDEANKYNECITIHELMPKRCREAQINYLNCRMKSGLMDQEDMTKLGFLQQNSWDNEEAEKKMLFERINQQKQAAWEAALKNAQKNRKKKEAQPTLPQ